MVLPGLQAKTLLNLLHVWSSTVTTVVMNFIMNLHILTEIIHFTVMYCNGRASALFLPCSIFFVCYLYNFISLVPFFSYICLLPLVDLQFALWFIKLESEGSVRGRFLQARLAMWALVCCTYRHELCTDVVFDRFHWDLGRQRRSFLIRKRDWGQLCQMC